MPTDELDGNAPAKLGSPFVIVIHGVVIIILNELFKKFA